MAVDLSDLIVVLQREVEPPGTNSFPTAVDDDWLGQLQDSFWEAKLFGFFANYSEADGLVSPISGTTELTRDWQQLIVLFAGIRLLRMKMINTNTSFKAKAGPVEFDSSVSANVMNEILKQLQAKIDLLLGTLAGSITVTQTYYINGLFERLSPTGGVAFYGGGDSWGSNYDAFTD